jgi:fibronectin type 3 domain-containing protein
LRRKPIRKVKLLLEQLETRLAPSATIVTTFHNDNASTGQNLNETTLTPANVNSASFGKLFSTPVDGQVYAQPLYLSGVNVTVGGQTSSHNVAYVATEHDSLYAIDADTGATLWQTSLLTPVHGGTVTPVSNLDTNSDDLRPEIGITCTPVIDPATGTIYVEARTKEVAGVNTHFIQQLHAIDISTGTEKFGGPAVIGDTISNNGGSTYTYVSGPWVNGTGGGRVDGISTFDGGNTSVDGKVVFNALREHTRTALTLDNGTIYMGFASLGDNPPYHGWVLGYNASNLQLTDVLNTTPNGGDGGIWQGGGRIAVDANHNLYLETGNGSFNQNTAPGTFPTDADYGDSFIKLSLDPVHNSQNNQNANGWGLQVADFFTVFNQAGLNTTDLDLGSGGPLLLPPSAGSPAHPNLMVGGGKEGTIYLIDRDNMGKFDPNTDHVVQELPSAITSIFSTPTYFNGSVYYAGVSDSAKAFSISNGVLSASPTSLSKDNFAFRGATLSVSANGTNNGILWGLDRGTNQLRAYDPANLAHELYNSAQAPNNRDALGSVVKFTVPTVVNGDVYIGTASALVAYGLIQSANAAPNAPSSLAATTQSGTAITLSWSDNSATPNTANGFYIEQSTDGVNFTQVATASAGTTSYTVSGLLTSTTYTFRIRAFNSLGISAYSNQASATTGSQAPALDFSGGFASSGSLLTLNGGTTVKGNTLELTDKNGNEVRSAFSTNKVNVAQFVTQFTFQIRNGTNPSGEGFTFVIQGVGNTALGSGVGGLGYAGLNNSIAVKFDLADNAGEGDDSTGLYTNGASPTVAGSIDLGPTGIDLHSQNTFSAGMIYDGTTLKVTITDLSTGVSATQSYAVNIPAIVGGSTAYVGFTGSTAGATAYQDIQSWTYTPGAPVIPAAPANLTATAMAGTQVSLSWSEPSSTQTGFSIERSTDGNHFNQIATTGASTKSYLDTGLITGVVYYYRVRATSPAGASAYSNVASATTSAVPAAPSNAQPTLITTGEIDLTFQDNSNNENGFYIFEQIASNNPNLIATLPADTDPAPNTLTYQVTNLTPGTTYAFSVQAFNNAGPSGPTSFKTATLTLAPTNLAAASVKGKVNLTWTAPTGAVTYNVYRSLASGGEAGTTPIATGLATPSYTDTSAAAGTTYFYEVTAVDAGGESALSNEATTTTTPAAPVNLTASASGTQVSLSWSTSTGAASYNVYRSTTSGGETGTQPIATGLTSTAFSDSGLANGTTYFYVVTAVGSSGESAFSTEAHAITVAVAPTNLAATPGNNQVSLTWNAPSGAATFNVYRSLTSGSETSSAPLATGLTSASYTDTSVTNGTTYFYEVTAVNAGGESAASAEASATPQFVPPPPAPTNLVAMGGKGQVSLSWSASAGASSYNVYRATTSGGETGTQPIASGLTSRAFTDTGRAANTTYYYVVTAVGSGGEGLPSTEAHALTTTAAPTNLAANAGNAQISLNWTAPAGAVTFNVYRSLTSGGETGTSPIASGLTSAAYTDSALTNGTTYYYEVTAFNAAGESAFSAEASGLPHSGTAPAAPTSLKAQASDGQVSLSWKASSGASSYNIYRSTTSNGEGATPVSSGIKTTTFKDTGLTDGTTYYYEVTAVNTGGESSKSNEASAMPFFSAKINFSNNTTQVPAGNVNDVGLAFGSRGNGLTFGWNQDNTANAFDRDNPASPDEQDDSFAETQAPSNPNASWQIAVPNGVYKVSVGVGDPNDLQMTGPINSFYKIKVQNALAVSYTPTASHPWNGGQLSVAVTNGLLTVANAAGAVNNKIDFITLTQTGTLPAPGLNFGGGFSGAAGLTTSGSSLVNGKTLQLTDGSAGAVGSAFSSATVGIAKFSTQFDFMLGSANAGGFTFTIQGGGPAALGAGDGGLGYAGIANSVAVKFDLFNDAGEGTYSTGLYVNGAAPTVASSVNLAGTGIDLHSSHNFHVSIGYDGTTMAVTITDKMTNSSFTKSYGVDIASIVGGGQAYVGFTASAEGSSLRANIQDWTFTPQ